MKHKELLTQSERTEAIKNRRKRRKKYSISQCSKSQSIRIDDVALCNINFIACTF